MTDRWLNCQLGQSDLDIFNRLMEGEEKQIRIIVLTSGNVVTIFFVRFIKFSGNVLINP